MATASSKPKKRSRLASLLLFVAGLTSSPPSGAKSLVLLGKTMTIGQVVALLNSLLTALQVAAKAKVGYTTAVAAANALITANQGLLSALRPALILAYGGDTQGLAACGIVVKPRAKNTPAQNAVKALKAKATRETNGTGKAPQPILTVTDVDGTVLGGPVNAPATAPATEPAPAPAAAGAATK